MVTTPLALDGPELAVRKWPDPDFNPNLTVAPDTAQPLASVNVAVMVVEFEPSALIDVADEARIIDVAGAVAVLVTLMGICADTLEPVTFAVMVSLRSTKLPAPDDASAE